MAEEGNQSGELITVMGNSLVVLHANSTNSMALGPEGPTLPCFLNQCLVPALKAWDEEKLGLKSNS